MNKVKIGSIRNTIISVLLSSKVALATNKQAMAEFSRANTEKQQEDIDFSLSNIEGTNAERFDKLDIKPYIRFSGGGHYWQRNWGRAIAPQSINSNNLESVEKFTVDDRANKLESAVKKVRDHYYSSGDSMEVANEKSDAFASMMDPANGFLDNKSYLSSYENSTYVSSIDYSKTADRILNYAIVNDIDIIALSKDSSRTKEISDLMFYSNGSLSNIFFDETSGMNLVFGDSKYLVKGDLDDSIVVIESDYVDSDGTVKSFDGKEDFVIAKNSSGIYILGGFEGSNGYPGFMGNQVVLLNQASSSSVSGSFIDANATKIQESENNMTYLGAKGEIYISSNKGASFYEFEVQPVVWSSSESLKEFNIFNNSSKLLGSFSVEDVSEEAKEGEVAEFVQSIDISLNNALKSNLSYEVSGGSISTFTAKEGSISIVKEAEDLGGSSVDTKSALSSFQATEAYNNEIRDYASKYVTAFSAKSSDVVSKLTSMKNSFESDIVSVKYDSAAVDMNQLELMAKDFSVANDPEITFNQFIESIYTDLNSISVPDLGIEVLSYDDTSGALAIAGSSNRSLDLFINSIERIDDLSGNTYISGYRGNYTIDKELASAIGIAEGSEIDFNLLMDIVYEDLIEEKYGYSGALDSSYSDYMEVGYDDNSEIFLQDNIFNQIDYSLDYDTIALNQENLNSQSIMLDIGPNAFGSEVGLLKNQNGIDQIEGFFEEQSDIIKLQDEQYGELDISDVRALHSATEFDQFFSSFNSGSDQEFLDQSGDALIRSTTGNFDFDAGMNFYFKQTEKHAGFGNFSFGVSNIFADPSETIYNDNVFFGMNVTVLGRTGSVFRFKNNSSFTMYGVFGTAFLINSPLSFIQGYGEDGAEYLNALFALDGGFGYMYTPKNDLPIKIFIEFTYPVYFGDFASIAPETGEATVFGDVLSFPKIQTGFVIGY